MKLVKRLTVLLLALVVNVGVLGTATGCQCSIFPWNKEEETGGELQYGLTYDGMGYMVTGRGNYVGKVLTVPATHQNLPVVGVNSLADLGGGAETIYYESISISDSVEYISADIFYDCPKLNYIHVEYGNPNYSTKNGNLYNKDKTELIYYAAGQKASHFDIPDGVKVVGEEAFKSCEALTSINIPNSVTTIEKDAFKSDFKYMIYDNGRYLGNKDNPYYALIGVASGEPDWTGDITLKIHKDTKVIADGAFEGSNITKVSVSSESPIFESGRDGLYRKVEVAGVSGLELVAALPQKQQEMMTISNEQASEKPILGIGRYAFWGFDEVKEIQIADSVTYIQEGAFKGCDSLTHVVIGNGVTNIGKEAFEDCSDLATVTLGAGVENIENSAFYGCSNLLGVVFPESLQTIGEYAFYECSSIRNIVIPDNTIHIGNYAFSECEKLSSVTIGKGLKELGLIAFSYCAIEEIAVDEDNTNYCSVDGVLYNEAKTKLIQYPNKKVGEKYTVLEGVTSVEPFAFTESALTEVVLADGIMEIGCGAFMNCNGLTTATLPESLVYIRGFAFNGCALAAIVIPDNVVYVGDYAFFDGAASNSAVIGKKVAFIGECGLFAESIYYTGTVESWCNLEVVTKNASFKSTSWDLYIDGELVVDLVIPGSVKDVKDNTFRCCKSIRSVTLENGVVSIWRSAFDCENLQSVVIPNSVRSIGYGAFASSNLTSVRFMGSVAEWEAVEKSDNWQMSQSLKEVVCNNGTMFVNK